MPALFMSIRSVRPPPPSASVGLVQKPMLPASLPLIGCVTLISAEIVAGTCEPNLILLVCRFAVRDIFISPPSMCSFSSGIEVFIPTLPAPVIVMCAVLLPALKIIFSLV